MVHSHTLPVGDMPMSFRHGIPMGQRVAWRAPREENSPLYSGLVRGGVCMPGMVHRRLLTTSFKRLGSHLTMVTWRGALGALSVGGIRASSA